MIPSVVDLTQRNLYSCKAAGQCVSRAAKLCVITVSICVCILEFSPQSVSQSVNHSYSQKVIYKGKYEVSALTAVSGHFASDSCIKSVPRFPATESPKTVDSQSITQLVYQSVGNLYIKVTVLNLGLKHCYKHVSLPQLSIRPHSRSCNSKLQPDTL